MYKIIETERLQLRILNQDAAALVLAFYEANRAAFEPWEPVRGANFYTLSYHKASLTAEFHQMTEGKLIRYWLFLKENPEQIIGSVCFQNLQKEPYQSGILGYKLGQIYQHQGYAIEGIRKCLDILFHEYHFHRIEAYIMPHNKPSQKLIERLDFQWEGTARSFARINGAWKDHNRYVLINPDDLID